MMKKFYEHKSHRLKNYNYSSNGAYFITVCVKNKECLFGEISVVAVDVIPLIGEMSEGQRGNGKAVTTATDKQTILMI